MLFLWYTSFRSDVMSKYYLVASYYDRNKKTYLNEFVVKLDGVDLSSLQKIDAFTSEVGKYGILNRIDRELGISNVNHLAVKYYKNKDSDPRYYRMIDKSSLFKDIAIGAKNSNVYRACMVNREDAFYLQELRNLLDLLKNDNKIKFQDYYSYEDELSLLVRKYYSYYDENNMEDMAEKQRILNLIMIEFSKYKTFRGWIVLKEKRNRGYQVNLNYARRESKVSQQNQIIPKSIKEYEEEYVERFDAKNNVSWKKMRADQHNLSDLEEDKEEFLEEDEMDMMYDEVVRRLRK